MSERAGRHIVGHGIVLVPDEELTDQLRGLAHDIVSDPAPIMRLGPQTVPHVTLAHCRDELDRAGSWWAAAAPALPAAIEVAVIGVLLAYLPEGGFYVPEGGVYCGLEIVRKPDIDTLHDIVISAAHEQGIAPIGAVGDDFRPHLTLGVFSHPAVNVAALRAERIPRTLTLTPVLGELGAYGTIVGVV